MNLLQAMDDDLLFRPWFRTPETWRAWRSFLAALFGLEMTEEQRAIYQQCTAREHAPTAQAKEAWLICGRRSGKSFTLALLAVYLAAFKEYRQHLAPGEKATILCLAADRRQSKIIMRYVSGLLGGIPMLARMVQRETAEAFELSNSTVIEVSASNYRTVRGVTLAAGVCDELAFWRSETSASPDFETLAALRPAMLTIPGAMLLCASSPYRRAGALWTAREKHYGHDGPVLVWQAPTVVMNPSVDEAEIAAAFEADPASAASEYLAVFRTDLEGFVDRDTLQACIDIGVRERPPERRWSYHAFVDPSGGSVNSMTLAVAHKEGEKSVILDLVRERRAPFSPESVTEEFSEVLRQYKVVKVHGDRYSGEWVRESFSRRGITYVPSPKTRSDIYGDCLPLVNSNLIALLDLPRLTTQVLGLERRTTPRGKDSIDHGPGGHDDLCNAAFGAVDVAWCKGRGSERREWYGPRPRPRIADPLADFRSERRPWQ